MGPANNLNYLINHLAAVMGKQSDQALSQQLGLGLSQYKVLMVLEWNPRIQQKAIADSLGQTEASVSRQVKLLKNKGLLESRLDPQNRRRHITVPTTKGMQITEVANDILRRNLVTDVSRLDDNQLVQLTASLQQLHQAVCRPGKLGACSHQLGI